MYELLDWDMTAKITFTKFWHEPNVGFRGSYSKFGKNEIIEKKKSPVLNKRNTTNTNAHQLKNANFLKQKEQLEYIRGQIDIIRNSVED